MTEQGEDCDGLSAAARPQSVSLPNSQHAPTRLVIRSWHTQWNSLKMNLDSRAFWLLMVSNAAVTLRDPIEGQGGWHGAVFRMMRVPLVYLVLTLLSDIIGLSDTEEVDGCFSFPASPLPMVRSTKPQTREPVEYENGQHVQNTNTGVVHRDCYHLETPPVRRDNSGEISKEQARALRALIRSASTQSGSTVTTHRTGASTGSRSKLHMTTADLYFMEQLAKLDLKLPDQQATSGDKLSPLAAGSQMLSKASTMGSANALTPAPASPGAGAVPKDSFMRPTSMPNTDSNDEEGAASAAATAEFRLEKDKFSTDIQEDEARDEMTAERMTAMMESTLRRTESEATPLPGPRSKPTHPFKSFKRKSFCGSMGNMMGLLFTDAAHIVMEKKEKAAHRKEK